MYPNVTAAAALSNYTLGGWRRENPHQTTLKKGRDDSYADSILGVGWIQVGSRSSLGFPNGGDLVVEQGFYSVSPIIFAIFEDFFQKRLKL